MEHILADNFGHTIGQPGDLLYPVDWSLDYPTLAARGAGILPSVDFDEAYTFDVTSSNDWYIVGQYDAESHLQPVSLLSPDVMSDVSSQKFVSTYKLTSSLLTP
jgi:hypothetical protein